jgi:hypothetical protein
MFWNRSSHHPKEDVREYVRDRLRLALDFATLGAYELSDHERSGVGEARGQTPDAPTEARDEPVTGATADPMTPAQTPPCREVRGASRPARAHAEVATGATCTCVELESAHRCSALERVNKPRFSRGSTRLAGLRRSRGGEVAHPEQPCTWVQR